MPRLTDGRRRPWRDNREVVNDILWILRTGTPWADLPERFSLYQTCHRCFQAWIKDGTLRKLLTALTEDLQSRGKFDLSEYFLTELSYPRKKGLGVGKTKRGKGTKFMAVADGAGIPVAIYTTSASPHEVKLVGATIEQQLITEKLEKLIADKAYDSDPLDQELATLGIELIAPHKRNRNKAKAQDGRKPRRYKRHWKVERFFAWIQNYGRIVVRYEYHLDNFLGFVHLACILILLKS